MYYGHMKARCARFTSASLLLVGNQGYKNILGADYILKCSWGEYFLVVHSQLGIIDVFVS